MKCYGLPCGAIGFVSHVSSYYTFVCLSNGRSAVPPWKPLSSWRWDISLSVIGFLGALAPIINTMVHCSEDPGGLIMLAVWKLDLSVVLFGKAIMEALRVRKAARDSRSNGDRHIDHTESVARKYHQQQEHSMVNRSRCVVHGAGQMQAEQFRGYRSDPGIQPDRGSEVSSRLHFKVSRNRTIGWCGVYFFGVLTGFVSLLILIIPIWSEVPLLRYLTYGFLAMLGALAMVSCWLCEWFCCGRERPKGESLSDYACSLVTAVSVCTAIYSDWALAAIADNMVGSPPGEKDPRLRVLFWIYFAAKRLPMLSC